MYIATDMLICIYNVLLCCYKRRVTANTAAKWLERKYMQMIERRAKDAGVDPPGLHDFRRCFALEMHRNGCDNITLSRLMGHSSLEVLKRYLDQTDSDFQKVHVKTSPADRWRMK
jgi:integrase/recombinase XerD